MTPREWEGLLLSATESVWRRVSDLSGRGGRGKSVGVGAAGDRTIYADKKAEDELLKALGRVKGVRVLSEEAGDAGDPEGRTLAIVDPLDGSSNFERGIPFYCTSVAVVEGRRLEDVRAAVVRDLVSGDAFAAVKGGGARKNGKPIETSRVTDLSAAVVGADLSRSSPDLVSGLGPLIGAVKRQVHLGANALEICYVADGRTDAFVDLRGRIRITDFAGAYLIAKEAGAVITDGSGGRLDPPLDLEHRFSFVASANASLHGELLRAANGHARRRSH